LLDADANNFHHHHDDYDIEENSLRPAVAAGRSIERRPSVGSTHYRIPVVT
jgi:hypothetical protein